MIRSHLIAFLFRALSLAKGKIAASETINIPIAALKENAFSKLPSGEIMGP